MMKTKICLALTLVLLLAAPLALAESAPAPATLTVTGSASVTLAPDFASVSLGASAQSDTVARAQADSAERMTALLAALRAQGIAEEDMQTRYFSISPVYDYNSVSSYGEPAIQGYRVENNLQVTVRDLSRLSAVLDAAMAAGANQSYGLTFDSARRDEAYDQALALAVREAARKAELLAAAAGVSPDGLVSLAEQNGGYGYGYAPAAKAMDSAAGTPILNGTLTVEASVTAVYAVQ